MSLKTLVLAIWAAIHPAAPTLPDAPEIADAIVVAVSQDPLPPVFGSREEDAAVMAYYALRESWLRKRAVGDGGRSFGVWQENATTGRADVVTQARAWLFMLHEGARICPDNPAAPLSGGCRNASHMASRRVAKARELLDAARRTLSATESVEPAPRKKSTMAPKIVIDTFVLADSALGRRSSRTRTRGAVPSAVAYRWRGAVATCAVVPT